MITNKNKNGIFFNPIQQIDKIFFMPVYEAVCTHMHESEIEEQYPQ